MKGDCYLPPVQDVALRFVATRLPGPSIPLTNAGVPAAPGFGTEHTGEEDSQLAVDKRHIPASEDLQDGEAEVGV